jgi:hypothetical protein
VGLRHAAGARMIHLAGALGEDHGDQAVHALGVGRVTSDATSASCGTCLIQRIGVISSSTHRRRLSTGHRPRPCSDRSAAGDCSPSRERGIVVSLPCCSRGCAP